MRYNNNKIKIAESRPLETLGACNLALPISSFRLLYRFDRDMGNNGGWRTMEQKLQKARNHAAMVSVSDGAANCV